MFNSKSIGNKIAEARKKKNLSQAELAQQIAISPQAVGKWERGESLPDIITLIRLAELLAVDLNYFSDKFESKEIEKTNEVDKPQHEPDPKNPNWNMSQGNWENLDFSGLKNLQEKFNSSNVKNCKFIGSDFSNLTIRNNNFEKCDFTDSDWSQSRVHGSNFANNSFKACVFSKTEFAVSYVYACDLSGADFSETLFRTCGLAKSTLTGVNWKRTSLIGVKLSNLVFEGPIADCSFEKCTFSKITFQQVKFTNTFFKYNNLKRVKFIDCQADRITYELLRNGKADLSGISLISGE
jgi:uncharacterized protein YjbI with pentapeptide repeats